MVNEEKVARFVGSESFRQMTADELALQFRVDKDEMPRFLDLLRGLERRGLLVNPREGQWVSPERAGLVVGRLQCNPRGFAFLVPVREGGEDVYVAEEDMRDAMHGDLVAIELHPPRRRRGRKLGPAGRVIRTIEHVNRRLVGLFVPGGRLGRVVPDNPALFRDVYVAPEDAAGARKRDKVLVELTCWPSLRRNPEGEVLEVLGQVGAPGVDVQSVILEFGLPREFPDEVLRAAEALPQSPPERDVAARRDLRGCTTVTVDPEDAKDFDDALSLERNPDTGRPVVLVHIADLSFYVPPGGVLDREARRRGTSVYLANEVVPMLPPRQSKETLSLVEGRDRLAKTVSIEFDDAGAMVDYSICYSVINVDRCMTYTEVQGALEAAESDEPAVAAAAEKLSEDILDLLVGLDALAGRVRCRRQEVGSIDLDVPDYDVNIGPDGRVIGVTQIVRDRSHGLVEEFMLSANRAVAGFLKDKKLPGLYRIHEPPPEEDQAEFATFIRAVMRRKIDPSDRKALQALLADVAGSNLAGAVNMQLLRTMQRALYSPKLQPHYALHFDRYCHFTSPVRRYPDLVVHQVLDQFLTHRRPAGKPALRLAGKLRRQWRAALPLIASHCNSMQQRADEAEREIINIKLLRYLQQHRGEVFEAVVTGVQEFGVFVRLEDYFVEGLIKVQDLGDDFFRYDDRSKSLVGTRGGRKFQLGQEMKVVLKEIDMARRRAGFLPAG